MHTLYVEMCLKAQSIEQMCPSVCVCVCVYYKNVFGSAIHINGRKSKKQNSFHSNECNVINGTELGHMNQSSFIFKIKEYFFSPKKAKQNKIIKQTTLKAT